MRRDRIIIGLFGLDSHEVGSVAVAALLRDAGMEVIYAGKYQTAESLIATATQEDADVIGVSCHSWEYLDYLPGLMEAIRREKLDVTVVAGGSVITPGDARALKDLGVAAVFGPGASPEEMVATIHQLAASRRDKHAPPDPRE